MAKRWTSVRPHNQEGRYGPEPREYHLSRSQILWFRVAGSCSPGPRCWWGCWWVWAWPGVCEGSVVPGRHEASPGGKEPYMISLTEQIVGAQREIALRRQCYPGWVKSGTLDPGDAKYQIL